MAEDRKKIAPSLHDTDFFAWTREQGAKLRARADVDWEYAAEEIESLGRSEKYDIEHRLEVLLLHLLRWQFQPDNRTPAARGRIREHRIRIRRRLNDSPSLSGFPATVIGDAYLLAQPAAANETGLELEAFPAECPWTIEQVLDENFWPDGK